MAENYLFISDIHGYDQSLFEKLQTIAKSESVPQIVFFLGDIVGTESLDKLQKAYYNGVVNHVKKLLKENPNATEEDILNQPINDTQTVADGVQELWNLIYEPIELSPLFKVEYIIELIDYLHFGHFISNLPESIKLTLRQDLEKNAKYWIDLSQEFIDRGSQVVIIEGNWDARTPLDFHPDKDECRSLPTNLRDFYFKDFLKSLNSGIIFYDQIGKIETADKLFVLLPYDEIINYDPDYFIKTETNKDVVLVSHAQACWQPIKGSIPLSYEGQKIEANIKNVISNYKPAFIVHGHLHDTGTDYLYKNIPVFYLPLRTFRFIDF